MRVLLDECVPARLRRELAGHDIRTVPETGWASRANGALLAAASGQFRNKIEFLLPFVPELQRVLGQVKPGRVYRVGA